MKKGVVVVVVEEERKIIRKRKWILISPFVRHLNNQLKHLSVCWKKRKCLKIDIHSVAVWPNGLIIFSLFGRVNIWPNRIKNGQSKRQICLNTNKNSKKWMTFFAKVSNFVKYVLKNLPKEQNTLFFAKSSNFAKFGHTSRSSRILSQLNFKLKIHFSLFSFREQAIPFEYGAKFFDTSNAKTRFLSFEECLLRSLFWTTWNFLAIFEGWISICAKFRMYFGIFLCHCANFHRR